jgi:hypothetical protein
MNPIQIDEREMKIEKIQNACDSHNSNSETDIELID